MWSVEHRIFVSTDHVYDLDVEHVRGISRVISLGVIETDFLFLPLSPVVELVYNRGDPLFVFLAMEVSQWYGTHHRVTAEKRGQVWPTPVVAARQEWNYSKPAAWDHAFSVQVIFIKNVEEPHVILNAQVLHGRIDAMLDFSVSILVVVRDDEALIEQELGDSERDGIFQ